MPAKRAGPFDPHDVWWSAECCRFGCVVLESGIDLGESDFISIKSIPEEVIPYLAMPSLILVSFSLELYLKCLKAIETQDHLKTHSLVDLFGDLSVADQEAVKRYTEEHHSGLEYPPTAPEHLLKFDFEQILAVSDDAFENIRYVHEGLPEQTWGFTAASVLAAVHQLILEKRPGWRGRPV